MKRKVGILTLGCKVNQYESEAIAEECERLGLAVSDPDGLCDVYIVNTCTVTAEADRKSCQMIRKLAGKNPSAPVIVAGCTSQRDPGRVSAIPGVAAVIGNSGKLRAAKLAFELTGRPEGPALDLVTLPDSGGFEQTSLSGFPRTRRYLKIEDGCNRGCSYCAIRGARGKVRSKLPGDVIREAVSFCEAGCREIVLTGIEIASYGADLPGASLASLLSDLDAACSGSGVRFRLSSLDPSVFLGNFPDRISRLGSLARHFHISVQSGSTEVLRGMRRGYGKEQLERALRAASGVFPGTMLSGDFIVGFPGETEENFLETKETLESHPFIGAHVFPFSARAGTPAALMKNRVGEQDKKRRCAELASAAAAKKEKLLDGLAGERLSVLFETREEGGWTGHSDNFAEVLCECDADLRGRVCDCLVLSREGARLTAVLI
ncbi:MAG: MiaB/RimO family radical SAM methylthiotransferase [Clostridia bacterium]|nr:MiaB/RimO family radical SAM methylthiotransferase [Clostridia bacterium]